MNSLNLLNVSLVWIAFGQVSVRLLIGITASFLWSRNAARAHRLLSQSPSAHADGTNLDGRCNTRRRSAGNCSSSTVGRIRPNRRSFYEPGFSNSAGNMGNSLGCVAFPFLDIHC